MYTNNDIQNMLNELNIDTTLLKAFCYNLEQVNATDRQAIMSCIHYNDVERFDRYDSDVCETFINTYINTKGE